MNIKIISFLVCLFSMIYPTAHGKVVESIIAIVNNEIITLTDIQAYKEQLKSGTMVDDLLVKPQDVPQILESRKKLIDLMIKEKILASEVKKQSLQITFDRVEKEIEKISSRNGISRDQLAQALQAQGVRFSDYQQFIKDRIERQSLIQQTITSKIKISDDEVAAYYLNQSGQEVSSLREVTVAHIFFKKNKKSPDQPLDKARIVLEKLKAGETFESLASQYSEDENFTDGGILGTFKPGDLVGILDQEIRSLKVGETSKVVPTKRGFHILKVTAQKLISDPKFEQEKGRIRGILYQRSFEKQFRFWLDQKRRNAFIRINKV